MFLVPGVLSQAEAARFVETAEARGFEHQGSRGPKYGEAFRDNHRLSFQDPKLAEHLWSGTGLAEAFRGCSEFDSEEAVGLNSNLRVYRYSAGQRFGRHIDQRVELGQGGRHTRYTLLIYLSSARGGETVFYGGRGRKVASVAPEPGLALFHRHGDECLEHEGAQVVAGVKYVLRSDVVFRD